MISEYVELTKRFIDYMSDEYAVDTDRIYGTGQSMGCMTTLILASEYPDLYAACMFVDGQWDTELLSNPEAATDASSDVSEDKPAMEMTGEKPQGMMGGNGGGAGGGATYHMASFDYAYNCIAVMEWLFQK